jgi:hypothetical protein
LLGWLMEHPKFPIWEFNKKIFFLFELIIPFT